MIVAGIIVMEGLVPTILLGPVVERRQTVSDEGLPLATDASK